MRILIVLLIAWFVVPLALLFLATQVGDPPLILVENAAENRAEPALAVAATGFARLCAPPAPANPCAKIDCYRQDTRRLT